MKTYSDTGLTANTTYRYRVYAFNGDGPSNDSNVAEATTPQAIPNAPTNLTATPSKAGSTRYVDLKWQDNSNNEANFVVERCTGAGCSNFQPLVSWERTSPRIATTERRSEPHMSIAASGTLQRPPLS